MKVTGKMIINSEEDSKYIQIVIAMKVNLLMESLKDLVLTYGLQVKYMKGNGKVLSSMV